MPYIYRFSLFTDLLCDISNVLIRMPAPIADIPSIHVDVACGNSIHNGYVIECWSSQSHKRERKQCIWLECERRMSGAKENEKQLQRIAFKWRLREAWANCYNRSLYYVKLNRYLSVDAHCSCAWASRKYGDLSINSVHQTHIWRMECTQPALYCILSTTTWIRAIVSVSIFRIHRDRIAESWLFIYLIGMSAWVCLCIWSRFFFYICVKAREMGAIIQYHMRICGIISIWTELSIRIQSSN